MLRVVPQYHPLRDCYLSVALSSKEEFTRACDDLALALVAVYCALKHPPTSLPGCYALFAAVSSAGVLDLAVLSLWGG